MASFTRRVQAVLTEEQFELLTRLSEQEGKPLSVLIREAVDRTYVEQAERERRRRALATLVSLDAPVDDWDRMEDEIAEGVRRE